MRQLPPIETDIVVIGAGASGAACAWDAAKKGFSVIVIGTGTPATELSGGCVRFNGRNEDGNGEWKAAERFLKEELAGLDMTGSRGKDIVLRQGNGAAITENIVPRVNHRGRAGQSGHRIGVIGLKGQSCFDDRLFSEMLTKGDVPVERRSLNATERAVRDMEVGEAVDLFAAEAGEMSADVVFVPPFIGLSDLSEGWTRLEKKGGRAFAEPVVDLSLPGIRLMGALRCAMTRAGAKFSDGASVIGIKFKDGSLDHVTVRSGRRDQRIGCKAAVFCGGGIVGGGLGVTGTDVVDPLGIFSVRHSEGPADAVRRACSAGIVTEGLSAIITEKEVPNLLVCGASLPGMNIVAGNGIGDAVATAIAASGKAQEAAR